MKKLTYLAFLLLILGITGVFLSNPFEEARADSTSIRPPTVVIPHAAVLPAIIYRKDSDGVAIPSCSSSQQKQYFTINRTTPSITCCPSGQTPYVDPILYASHAVAQSYDPASTHAYALSSMALYGYVSSVSTSNNLCVYNVRFNVVWGLASSCIQSDMYFDWEVICA